MKILNGYIGRNLLYYTLLTIAILTFVMISAQLYQAFDMIARGVPASTIGRFILFVTPYMLQFTAPLAMLCATVLVFSRMSADNEITAMRASGISLWQIITPAILLTFTLTGICLYLQLFVAPEFNYQVKQMQKTEAEKRPLAFLEPGRHVEIPEYILYVGGRKEDKISAVQIYKVDKNGKLIEDLTASRGEIQVDESAEEIKIKLEDVIIAYFNEKNKPDHVDSQTITIPIHIAEQLEHRKLRRAYKYMDIITLFAHIHIYNERGMETTPLFIVLHNRLAMGLSPLAFLMIGIPFGVRTRRSESSIGLLISISLAMFFYLFVHISQSLEDQSAIRPELLIWLPSILYQVGGIIALHRFEKR